MKPTLIILACLIFGGCQATTTNRDMKAENVAVVQSDMFWQEPDWNSHPRATTSAVTSRWDDPWASDPVSGYNDLPKPKRGRPSGHMEGGPVTPNPKGQVY